MTPSKVILSFCMAAVVAGCGASNRAAEPRAPVSASSDAEPAVEPTAPVARSNAPVVHWPDLSRSEFHDDSGAKDVALIVAIEDYAFLPDVPGALQNAKEWYGYLTKSRQIPESRVRFLANEEAADFAIRGAVEELAKMAEPGAKAWVIFVGHGAPKSDGSDGLMVAADAQQTAAGIENRSVGQAEVLRVLTNGATTPVLIVDACYSGKKPDGTALVAGLQSSTVVNTVVPPTALVLTAAASDQYAGPLPGAQRPAFSYLLLGALRGWGDVNSDGKVTADEAVGYTRSTLQALLSGSRAQTPSLNGEGTAILASSFERGPDLGALVLDTKAGAPPPVEQRAVPAATSQRVGRLRIAATCREKSNIELPSSGLQVVDITDENSSALVPLALSSRYDVATRERVYDPVAFDAPLGQRVLRITSDGCGTVERAVDIRSSTATDVQASLDGDSASERGNAARPKGYQVQLFGNLVKDLDTDVLSPGVELTGAFTRRWFRVEGAISYWRYSSSYSYGGYVDGLSGEETERGGITSADAAFMGRLPIRSVALYTGLGLGYRARDIAVTGYRSENYVDTSTNRTINEGGLALSWITGVDFKFGCDWGMSVRANLTDAPSIESHPLIIIGAGPTWQPNDCTAATGKAQTARR